MSWKALQNYELSSSLLGLAKKSKGCDWAIAYSPEKGIDIYQFPDWETSAMQESDAGKGTMLVHFMNVKPIKITTCDTITLGSLEEIECENIEDSNVVTIVVKGLKDELYEVIFRCVGCELNMDAIE